MKIVAIIIVAVLLQTTHTVNVLSNIDCINFVKTGYHWKYGGFLGLSMDLLEVLPQLDNQLFQNYLLTSKVHGSWSNILTHTFHNPIGAKYNCPVCNTQANAVLNCTF